MSKSFQSYLNNCLSHKTEVISGLKQTFVRPLIQLAVRVIEQEHVEEGILDRISQKYKIPQGDVEEYYAAIYLILKTFFRSSPQSIKPTDFKQCLQDLKLSPECIEDLSAVVYGSKHKSLLSGTARRANFYPRLVLCKWRIDVTIASSLLDRVLVPSIIMEWILCTGESITFELSLPKFHRLRHAISNILVDVQSLEQQSTFKNIQSGAGLH